MLKIKGLLRVEEFHKAVDFQMGLPLVSHQALLREWEVYRDEVAAKIPVSLQAVEFLMAEAYFFSLP
jgi:hypothetical protein